MWHRRRPYAGWPAAVVAVVVVLLTAGMASGCSLDRAAGWTAIGPPSAQAVGSVMTLTAAGDSLLVGLASGNPQITPVLQVWSGEAWRELPVAPTSPYAKLAVWASIVAGPDGSLVAVGGARGGAHANVRWTVWTGNLSAGLTEQEQTFETFGGWGAGDKIGPVITGAGPLLIGSWDSARTGLDLDVWLPEGQRWVRQSSAGTALESTPEAMVSGRSVIPWGVGALISGSVLRLGGDAVRTTPAVWRSTSGGTGWTRIDLPDGGTTAEATGAVCTDDACTVEGVVDGHLAVWRVDAAGSAKRLDGIPSVAIGERDPMPAPVLVDGHAAMLVTDQDDQANSVVVREGSSGWSPVARPWGQARAFATVGGRLYAVCRNGDSPVQVWSHAA